MDDNDDNNANIASVAKKLNLVLRFDQPQR
jgi:hypothetical protein